MILCLNTGSVAKLVVVGSEFQTLAALSTKNWLRTPLLQCDLKSLYACPLVYYFHFKNPALIDWLKAKQARLLLRVSNVTRLWYESSARVFNRLYLASDPHSHCARPCAGLVLLMVMHTVCTNVAYIQGGQKRDHWWWTVILMKAAVVAETSTNLIKRL